MLSYQQKISEIIANGALENYPTEASRSHFKYHYVEKHYQEAMKIGYFNERKQYIQQHVLPHIRAIPEANLAIGHLLYPIEQDERVALLYDKFLKSSTALIQFYKGRTDAYDNFNDFLLPYFIAHRNHLNPAEKDIIIQEIKRHYTPPALAYATEMIKDTLRQLPTETPIRSRYIQLLHWLDPKQMPPNFISIADSMTELMSYRPI